MFENIRLAFQGIWSHKLRSVLTMLGIIIGIAAIITIVSTIKGTNDQIKASLTAPTGSTAGTDNSPLLRADSTPSGSTRRKAPPSRGSRCRCNPLP